MTSPRVVSLIASATEIICALGLRKQLVGISHECDFPSDVRGLPVLSAPKVDPQLPGEEIDRQVREIVRDGLSVYRVEVAELEKLRPDLIVTQDHCEVCAVTLQDVEDALCRVTLSDTKICSLHPGDLNEIRRDFQLVADAAGVSERAEELRASFDARLRAVEERVANGNRPSIALIEWIEPPMVAGGWMPELAKIAGADPVIVDSPKHFVTVTWADIASADPDLVVIAPCGYTIEKTLEELENPELLESLYSVPAAADGRCFVADGNAYFNRPGP
ncbi:MAG: ABC transporter substrate-binding protein, partial [Gemmatimonadetes bacterium]|nr:ABC transporter substrate-binding protein [Gemmatimonadota bacterium]